MNAAAVNSTGMFASSSDGVVQKTWVKNASNGSFGAVGSSKGAVDRLRSRVVLDALASLNQRSGSKESEIQKCLRSQHPELSEVAIRSLPLVLRKLQASRGVTKSAEGTYSATIAGKVTHPRYDHSNAEADTLCHILQVGETPEHLLVGYFTKLFQIDDKIFSGWINPPDFQNLLQMSGFCLRANHLQAISSAVKLSSAGRINYVEFIPTLVSIVKAPAPEEVDMQTDQDLASPDDWDLFASALSSLSLDDGEAV